MTFQQQDIGSKKIQVLVSHESNPNSCTCGWYIWKKICGCSLLKDDFKCGGRKSTTGRSAFCRTPAPINQVTQFVVNEPCRQPAQHVAPLIIPDDLFQFDFAAAAAVGPSRQHSVARSMSPAAASPSHGHGHGPSSGRSGAAITGSAGRGSSTSQQPMRQLSGQSPARRGATATPSPSGAGGYRGQGGHGGTN
ncbi:hypothetical protein F5144DRAFT_602856 [Chaetomium tenue]|uniref:Uncharacterized protein n=1 Tax=Chaetomium tenue TaxID=1854479 RepID=A0ACB7PC37_9PEZI|nr:hypothetical protein F5144DRAFT_602856 [Chaetomium globosum]